MVRLIARFKSIFGSLSATLTWVGGGVLLLMTAFTFINIIVRPISGSILGVTEVISYAFVIVVCSGFAYVALRRGNVCVDILVSKLSPRAQSVSDILGNLIGIGVFAIIAWQSYLFAGKQAALGESAPVLDFPIYPFRYLIVFGSILLCLALLINLFESLLKMVKK